MTDWLVTAFLVLGVDQGSKVWALRHDDRTSLASGRGRHGPRIRVVLSSALARGTIQDRRALVALWVVAVGGSIVLLHQIPAPLIGRARLGLGAALGGATGNLIDHVWRGAVVDFIDLRVWPVFNLADLAIVGGIMVMAFSRL